MRNFITNRGNILVTGAGSSAWLQTQSGKFIRFVSHREETHLKKVLPSWYSTNQVIADVEKHKERSLQRLTNN